MYMEISMMSEAYSLLAAYSKLNKNRYFLNLKSNTHIYPIWDDHDYGINDSGKIGLF